MSEEISPTRLFLFEGLTPAETDAALRDAEIIHRVFRRGEHLCDPNAFERALVLIVRGECSAVRGGIELNTLHAGDTFGIISLFSARDSFPTTVIARRETEALFLPRESVERMMAAYPRIAVNLLTFLTGRAEFLNDRIAMLTAPSVEDRLAARLLKLCRKNDGQPFPLNRARTAEELGCGRASLYRALDDLIGRGLIRCEQKLIVVLSPGGLERMVQP